jgi:hypothetical protein
MSARDEGAPGAGGAGSTHFGRAARTRRGPGGAAVAPEPLAQEVVAAWTKAGAEVGWMGLDMFGQIVFRPGAKGLAGDVPAFRFGTWPEGTPLMLPAPPEFGLALDYVRLIDTGLRDLAALKGLQALDLTITSVTDAGLKELAALRGMFRPAPGRI